MTACGWRPPVLLTVAFAAIAMLGLIIHPDGISEYFILQHPVYDAGHYFNIATFGYEDPAQAAFYPLWPLVMWGIASIVGDSNTILWISLFAFALFIATLPILQRAMTAMGVSAIGALLTISFYALNPNSMFHALAYSESLFSLISVLLVWHGISGSGDDPKVEQRGYWFIQAMLMTLLSLGRPVLPQLLAAIAAGIIGLKLQKRSLGISIWIAVTYAIAGVAGYAIFGLHTLQMFQDFWQPFHAQAFWDRHLGLNWSLFIAPHSTGGSPNVLTWDLLAFYLPPAGLIYGMVSAWRGSSSLPAGKVAVRDSLPSFFMFFSLAFASAHSLIAFLSYPEFMSLGRHVWGTPWVYVGFGLLVHQYPIRSLATRRWVVPTLWGLVVVSSIYLFHWWIRYSRGSWIG